MLTHRLTRDIVLFRPAAFGEDRAFGGDATLLLAGRRGGSGSIQISLSGGRTRLGRTEHVT
jgi:hypothetical protein